jgi:hypothetical protein
MTTAFEFFALASIGGMIVGFTAFVDWWNAAPLATSHLPRRNQR